MTDLKDLLDNAAGTDPAVTDDDLMADLRRGKRSARRRHFAGVAGGATAIALVAAGAWAVLPDADPTGLDSGPAGQTAATQPPSQVVRPPSAGPVPTTAKRTGPDHSRPPVQAPAPARPVKLVPDGVVRPGTDLVCGLKPEGWEPVVYKSPKGVAFSSMVFKGPGLDPIKYEVDSTELSLRHARIWNENGQMLVEKYGQTWESLPHVMAGSRQAVATLSNLPKAITSRDVHMRMGATQLLQTTGPRALGWDLPTQLRFTASCTFAK
jgi:hypothetical protein